MYVAAATSEAHLLVWTASLAAVSFGYVSKRPICGAMDSSSRERSDFVCLDQALCVVQALKWAQLRSWRGDGRKHYTITAALLLFLVTLYYAILLLVSQCMKVSAKHDEPADLQKLCLSKEIRRLCASTARSQYRTKRRTVGNCHSLSLGVDRIRHRRVLHG